MHAWEHVELSLFVGRQAAVLGEAFTPLDDRTLYRYWSCARARLDRWGLAFRRFRKGEGNWGETSGSTDETLVRLIEEVLLSEPLVRTLTLLLEQRDRRRGEVMAAPIARSIFMASLDTRRKALDVLLKGELLSGENILSLDALRLRLERWIDVILGRCSTPSDHLLLEELAIDPRRARDFTATTHAAAVESWPLLHASVRSVLSGRTWGKGINEELNLEVAASVLAMLEPPLFHETGLPRSLFMLRLKNTFQDMQAWLDGYEDHQDHAMELPAARPVKLPHNRLKFQ